MISGNVSYGEMEEEMQAAGVDNRSTIIDRADSGRYSDDVEQNRYSADDHGVTFTPTLVLDGETIAPTTALRICWTGSAIVSPPRRVNPATRRAPRKTPLATTRAAQLTRPAMGRAAPQIR
ncbi:DsbA family protein [Halomicrococcus sp. NG-SE-24]|uniref:DsbA family protein n=1 Tax=Halomicrococcus sp. NG-SE-24 TaxID=3436928 RepID=UPI003D99742B